MEQITQNGMTMQRMEGQEAQDYMNSLLMEVAGTDTMEDAHRTLLGRPRVNEHREETTNMHLRLPKSLRRYAVQAAKRDGYDNQSEYVRALIAADARRHNVQPANI